MGSIAIALKKKEAKTITFTITDSSGDRVDCTSADYTFAAKVDKDATTYLFNKVSGDFTTTYESQGVVSVGLTSGDTNGEGAYIGELKIKFNDTNIDKSQDISVFIEPAITD